MAARKTSQVDAPRARGTPADEALARYRAKRDFQKTPEPEKGGAASRGKARQFVVQKHWASRLHYDFRLELDGTMKSWAVPKGPSLDPRDKRMAVQVEDHPIAYNRFEGRIPQGHYGAGQVIVWDRGRWTPLSDDPAHDYAQGKLKFALEGHKLHGQWALVRMRGRGSEKQPAWLLIKEHDEHARPASEYDVVQAEPDSVQARASRAASVSEAKPKAALSGRRAALPERLQPQLATLVERPPADSSDWLYELKFDGYRLLARVARGQVRLFTRNGHDWTDKMPQLAQALATLPLRTGWLDGEIIVMQDGAPSFQALQNAFDGRRTEGIVYYLFDLPFAEGRDLRALPLVARRARLAALLEGHDSAQLRLSEAFEADAGALLASACGIGFEGVIGKRKSGTYVSRRSADWIKLKCGRRQEFVIGGYTDPKNSRQGFGALLLGVHDAKTGALHYAGNVGSGFSDRSLAQIAVQLRALAAPDSPFAPGTRIAQRAHWVKPQLVAEVSFAEWTGDHHVRQAVFHGLRSDKSARNIVREVAQAAPLARRRASAQDKGSTTMAIPPQHEDAALAGVRITHPERVIDPSTGLTKLDLVRYYARVAPLILPHLKGRPVSLVRAPAGIAGEKFFQKHEEGAGLAGANRLPVALDPDHPPLLEIASVSALVAAAQMNVVELHTWNARKDRIEQPDRITFDLDPGEGVAWEQVQEAAQLVHSLLGELGLSGFLKTSGGKGLHVVVPIRRSQSWDEAKDFSHAVVRHLAQLIPERFVAKSGPRNRVGRIFVDYLRNGRGATTASAWSARARAGMGVSVPVRWNELAGLRSGAHWTVQTVEERFRIGNDAWAGYATAARALGAARRTLLGG